MQTKRVPNPQSAVAELERAALVARGTDNQRARHAAHVLPEDEILAIARAELFAPFDAFKPWHNRYLRPATFRHKDRTCRGHIAYETTEATEMDHDAWEVLAAIQAAAKTAEAHEWISRSIAEASSRLGVAPEHLHKVRVEPLGHWATCQVCHAEHVYHSAKVHILWAGRSLTREYRLDINL